MIETYGLSKSSLSLLLEYLTSRKQRMKIDPSNSLWNDIKRVVPQGLILGPVLFIVFINDIMLLMISILLMMILFMTVAKTYQLF